MQTDRRDQPKPSAADEWATLRGGFSEYVQSFSPCSDSTRDFYAKRVDSFAAWAQRRDLSLLTIGAEEIGEYVDARDATTGTALRWAFRLLVSRGLRPDNPLSRAVYMRPQPTSTLSQGWAESLRLFGETSAFATQTVRGYVFDVAAFRRWCRDNAIDHEQAERDHIASFLDYLRERMGQASLVRRFAAIRFYHRWLQHRGVRQDDPTEGIRLKQASRVAKQPFSGDELRRLLAACRTAQERACLLLLIDTGLRLAELTGLRLADIDFENETMRVRGKGGKERLIAASPRSLQVLRQCMDGRDYPWYSQRSHGAMTPEGLSALIKRVGRRAGVEHVHPHRFRTTFACMFLDASSDLLGLQLLMGHSKIEVTAHYARWGAERRALDTQRRLLAAGSLYGQEGVTNNGYETRQGEVSAPMDEGAVPAISVRTGASTG